GRWDRADDLFARSASLCRRMEAKFFGARTNVLWADLLIRRRQPGDHDRARQLLLDAREVATAQGYAVVERRATEALASLGASS
ncbi:MAG: hypothetical protein JO368_12840, partial [Acidimicrobiales bacterium]|nr:hypothetical protein [Acidimicrobiales bacterium]